MIDINRPILEQPFIEKFGRFNSKTQWNIALKVAGIALVAGLLTSLCIGALTGILVVPIAAFGSFLYFVNNTHVPFHRHFSH